MNHEEQRQSVIFYAAFEHCDQQFQSLEDPSIVHGSLLPQPIDGKAWKPIPNPARVKEYWRTVLPVELAAHSYNYPKEWCGGFTLFCLKQAGLAHDIFWKQGYLRGAWLLDRKAMPQPGDIAYFAKYQHHAIVESVDPVARTFDSIDGNQPAIARYHGRPLSSVAGFYSISQLLLG